MCNISAMDFASKVIREPDVKGRRVLEVGALDVNGSVRPEVCKYDPLEYTGVDIVAGKGVDKICRAEDLLDCFSAGTMDLVIATEVLEHVRDWRRVIGNIKVLLRPGGALLVTTRSYGFGYHGYPYDFWRFEDRDMREIFSDMTITDIESDTSAPGIFLKAVKEETFVEKNLCGYRLYSIIKGCRVAEVTWLDCALFRVKQVLSPRGIASRLFPERMKRFLKKMLKR